MAGSSPFAARRWPQSQLVRCASSRSAIRTPLLAPRRLDREGARERRFAGAALLTHEGNDVAHLLLAFLKLCSAHQRKSQAPEPLRLLHRRQASRTPVRRTCSASCSYGSPGPADATRARSEVRLSAAVPPES